MHETHLLEPIIKNVAKHAKQEGANSVTTLRLKIGNLLGITDASLRETFTLLSQGTILENAALETATIPGTCIEVASFDIE